MAYLLRTLLFIMAMGICLTTTSALGWVNFELNHIKIAVPAFIYTMFTQAFIMFYFIGVSRLITNVHLALHSSKNLDELFDAPPQDLSPYKKKVDKFIYDSTLSKRQTVPWSILMLALGTIGLLLGAAHDTNMVAKTTHSGVVYGFILAMFIGFFKQWKYLGKNHKLLREIKALFSIPDDAM